MTVPNVVIDTNVVIAALRSRKGASNKLMKLVGTRKFEIHDSVALILEYEEVLQRQRTELGLSEDEVAIFLDSICALAHHHEIYFQWRPWRSAPSCAKPVPMSDDKRSAPRVYHVGEVHAVEYEVPERLLRGRERVRVGFRPAAGSATGSVFEVRLVRPTPAP